MHISVETSRIAINTCASLAIVSGQIRLYQITHNKQQTKADNLSNVCVKSVMKQGLNSTNQKLNETVHFRTCFSAILTNVQRSTIGHIKRTLRN